MRGIRLWPIAGLAVASALVCAGQQPKLNPAVPLQHVDNGPNSEAAQKAHYVVLVSLDGFRWDYAERDRATHLLALGKLGAWAPQGMLPSYPSVTFPNHLTIVTGLYPEHHGIVANRFIDPEKKAEFSDTDAKAVGDGSWYNGVPLWSLAEGQGMRTVCLFWPGCEAEIAGHRPSWYAGFTSKSGTGTAAEQARIEDTAALLKLPEAERPHLILIHYDDADDAGHMFGPDAPETRAAVHKLDVAMGKLKAALDRTGLPIDLVIVSDHGMAKTEGPWIALDSLADLRGFKTVGELLYAKDEADRQRVYNQLKHATSEFLVYRNGKADAGLHTSGNPRMGDPIIVATGAYPIRAHAPAAGTPDTPPPPGAHGYDARTVPQMKAIFIAAGPDIAAGKTVAPFENVNLYPWMAHMLGLSAPKSDGNLNILAGTLRDDGGPTPEPANQKQAEPTSK